jgi:hypothetical protein
MGPTQSPIQWAPGFFLGVKQVGCGERDNSSPCTRLRMSSAIILLLLWACMERTERTGNVCASLNYTFSNFQYMSSNYYRIMKRTGKMWRGYSRSGIERAVSTFVWEGQRKPRAQQSVFRSRFEMSVGRGQVRRVTFWTHFVALFHCNHTLFHTQIQLHSVTYQKRCV